jgi:hypothetical protein
MFNTMREIVSVGGRVLMDKAGSQDRMSEIKEAKERLDRLIDADEARVFWEPWPDDEMVLEKELAEGTETAMSEGDHETDADDERHDLD